MFQKVFSMQMSSAVGMKIDKSDTGKKTFSRPVKVKKDNFCFE